MLICGVAGHPRIILYLFFCTMPFGSLAVVPAQLAGGLTLTPTPIVGTFLILRYLFNSRGFDCAVDMAFDRLQLLLLFLFWVAAVYTTIFMPHIFSGQIDIIPVRTTLIPSKEPLRPTIQNFSQLLYLSISVFCVFAFARLLRSRSMQNEALVAMIVGGLVVVTTGLLDIASKFVPIQAVLEPFRTANYAMMTEGEI
jgi:hypothetical protein